MSHIHYISNSHIAETALTTSYSLIWSGDVILTYALFQCSSDDIDLSIWNDGVEVVVFNLESMRNDYRLDGDIYQPILKMYSSNRWVLDFRLFGGMYPQGPEGVQVKMRATSGSKTLENAMIVWSKR